MKALTIDRLYDITIQGAEWGTPKTEIYSIWRMKKDLTKKKKKKKKKERKKHE